MKKTAVLNVVGLTPKLLGPYMPKLTAWAQQASMQPVSPAFPAVTCTAQANYLTGQYPHQHGIVGNGWYYRDEAEVHFWKQSNHLVQAPKIWDAARALDESFTCANLFWWFNMYSSVDYSITPRPMYPADGRKIPDVYAWPYELRTETQAKLGTFPLFEFWGPRTSIRATRWIAEAAKLVDARHNPTLSLVYLPHLDYNLQRHGTSDMAKIATDLKDADDVCADLIAYFESLGANVIVLSEYGITDVSRPIHINRVLCEQGLIAIRKEMGLELLDPGASKAFAVADHQIAHVYVNDKTLLSRVRRILEGMDGIEAIRQIDHPRAGDFIAVAKPEAWFTYYHWLDDDMAPDFARTVDIHRKPGYDPVELFTNTSTASIAWKLAKRKLGFRALLDVIPLDASLVKGSHGRTDVAPEDSPVFISHCHGSSPQAIASVNVYQLILQHLI